MTTAVPILLYHRVSDRAEDPFAVAPARFDEHVAAIVQSGRTPLTMTEVADCLRGARAWPQRPVAITFDDGYADTPQAISRLRDADLRATVYVTTGTVGVADGLSGDQVRELAALPGTVELGAHTVSHRRLDEINRDHARREIADSKHTLESIIDKPIQTFAYPHGAYDVRARELVIEAGFQSAAAVKNALSHDGDDPWAVARWTVMKTTEAEQVRAFLDGRDAPLAWSGERLRTRAYRLVRRARRRIRRTA
jgi:peptidoglycan/xylan/chitin deacetylase (PgdA/CDA1 family)